MKTMKCGKCKKVFPKGAAHNKRSCEKTLRKPTPHQLNAQQANARLGVHLKGGCEEVHSRQIGIKNIDISEIKQLIFKSTDNEDGSNLEAEDYNVFIEKGEEKELEVYHEKAQEFFDQRQGELQRLYYEKGQGAVRDSAGKLYEGMIDELMGTKDGFISKSGYDDLISTKYEHPTMGIVAEQNNLQVDRHIWKNGSRYAFVEAKTYLDKPYLERAVSDFLEIKRALEIRGESTKNLKFLVFAGQNALSNDALNVQRARFWTESSSIPSERIDMQVFFVTKGKRSSSKPLYSNKFDLDYSEITRFMEEFV